MTCISEGVTVQVLESFTDNLVCLRSLREATLLAACKAYKKVLAVSERQLFQRVKTTGALQRRHGWAASDVSGTTPQDSPQDSEDGEHCVAGDAAHVAAIPSHPHEAAFSPSDSPAEEWKWKQQTKYIGKKNKTVVNLHELFYLIVFFLTCSWWSSSLGHPRCHIQPAPLHDSGCWGYSWALQIFL